MPVHDIDPRHILRDVRAGLDDGAIMTKYGLSSSGLERIYEKLVSEGLLRSADRASRTLQRVISVKDIIEDVSIGMDRDNLMQKYSLSPRMLAKVCSMLLRARSLGKQRLFGGMHLRVTSDNLRDSQRYSLDFDVPVYEAGSPEMQGSVVDVSEDGFRLTGLDVKAGEVKKLVIMGDPFGEVAPLECQARCCWVKHDEFGGITEAGFELTGITDANVHLWEKLVRLAAFTD